MRPVEEVLLILERDGVALLTDDDPRSLGVVLPEHEAVLTHERMFAERPDKPT